MSDTVLAQAAATSSPCTPLADRSPTQQIELRYLNATNALLDDAIEHESPRILVDVLTWTLARMVVGYDAPAVAGDILRRLGEHIGTLAERQRTQRQAKQAKKEGRALH